ncbi:MAG: hypothetical protein ABW061_02210 [Polyangiaceae bacterium]
MASLTTRIPPLGFAPVSARVRRVTAPVGADYGSARAIRNYDEVAVHLGTFAPLAPGLVHVSARVLFQSTVRAFVEELASANVTDQRSDDLKQIWQNTGARQRRLRSLRRLACYASALPGGEPRRRTVSARTAEGSD